MNTSTYILRLPKLLNNGIKALFLFFSVCVSPVMAAVSYNFSGFGTLGYAISNQTDTYEKYINNEGTFNSDSILAGQLDIQFTSKLGITLQTQLAPDESDDSGWEAKIAWAFLSYRPTNDWLIRVGKTRVPGYLNSQNRDVGVSYDYTRIPSEFNTISPAYDLTGLAVNKAFVFENGDLFVDAYYGKRNIDWRDWVRNDVEGYYSSGSVYTQIAAEVMGVAFTYQNTDSLYVLGMHNIHIENRRNNGFLNETAYVELYPGEGFYSTDEAFGAKYEETFSLYIINVGADVNVGNGIRLAAEIATRGVSNIEIGMNSYHGYASLRKKIDDWTPYIFYSRVKGKSSDLEAYNVFNHSEVSPFIPGSDTINASQKTIADIYQAYDQYSIALGTSYNFSPMSKVKAEVMLTHVGVASSLFDSTIDNLSDSDVTTLSISYNFAF